MKGIEELIGEIAKTPECVVRKRALPIEVNVGYILPTDLQFYLQTYQSITFYGASDYPITIVGIEEFRRANPVIIGEDAADDISHQWFIIGHDGKSQYITIDLAQERLGRCYDSFWDRHGVAGEQPIIANSFSELVQRFYEDKGAYYYWLQDNFQDLGDAYDS